MTYNVFSGTLNPTHFTSRQLDGLQSSNWTSDLFSTYSYIFNVS